MIKKLIIILLLFISIGVKAQVYETQELKFEEEKHMQEKIKSFGFSEEAKIEKTKKISSLSNSDLVSTFVLMDIKAIDYSGKHSESEMKLFQDEMLNEVQVNDMRISKDYSTFYIINRKDNSKFSEKEISLKGNQLLYVDCDKCNMDAMIIVENNNQELIIETPAQDRDSFYTVRLTFKK